MWPWAISSLTQCGVLGFGEKGPRVPLTVPWPGPASIRQRENLPAHPFSTTHCHGTSSVPPLHTSPSSSPWDGEEEPLESGNQGSNLGRPLISCSAPSRQHKPREFGASHFLCIGRPPVRPHWPPQLRDPPGFSLCHLHLHLH